MKMDKWELFNFLCNNFVGDNLKLLQEIERKKAAMVATCQLTGRKIRIKKQNDDVYNIGKI